MRPDHVFVAGLGTYLPERVSTRQAVEEGWYDADEAATSGWTSAAVAGDVSAPDMAVYAARLAMRRSGHRPEDIAVLMHACTLHQGPDIWPPQQYIQRHTIGGTAPALELRQSCNGMLGAMELSCCFLAAHDATAALITGADNFGTPLFDRWRYLSGAGTNRTSIVGDAAAALVLSRRGGFARLRAIRSMSLPDLEELTRSGVPLFPPDATVGRKADLGARVAHLRHTDPEAFTAAREALQDARSQLAEQALAEAGIEPAQVTRVTHVFGGGVEYVKSVLSPVGIDASRGLLEFGRGVGHLGTCDHAVGLDHLLTTGQVGAGDHVLMMSNGGASLTCAVLSILTRPDQRQP